MVSHFGRTSKGGLGLTASALLSVLCLSGLSSAAVAQPRSTAPVQPIPVDGLTVNRLVWSSLAALDHANLTGNYSVLRDLGAPSFQAKNSAATLAGIFEAVRSQAVDLSATLLVAPTYEFAPGLIDGGLLRAKGVFALRPTAIAFDLIYQNVAGQWRLLGISVAPVALAPPAVERSRR